jgi:Icc-related predicted phosphoesterase
MIIDCISDLHGHYPELEGGDLLIVAGDLTARHTIKELDQFNEWIREQDYRQKILIAGNHDTFFEKGVFDYTNPVDGTVFVDPSCDYLCDSGTEFKGLKIWGSPWSLSFPGINPKCTAFTGTEEELAERYALIPEDTDILVTHGPPWGILDKVNKGSFTLSDPPVKIYEHAGSKSLALQVGRMKIPPKLWVWGHVHEEYGIDLPIRQKPCKMVNASHVNERYQPVNKPIRIIL